MRLNLIFHLMLVLNIGCATYQSKVSEARKKVASGDLPGAIEKLKPLAEKSSDDQLVYLLDYATVLQLAEKYNESSAAFMKADRLSEMQDYTSVSNVTGSVLGSEEMIQYKGEAFEKYLINTMLAINFAIQNKTDEALVESRRINEKLVKMRTEGKKNYELSPFANYFSAILWESQKRFDDAYIAYERSYNLDPNIPGIGADLARSAKLASREESYKKWKQKFTTADDPSWFKKENGELIVIFQQGWIPRKQPRSDAPRYPYLVPTTSLTQKVKVKVARQETISATTYDLGKVAVKTLNDDYAALVARRAGSFVAKSVVADQIRQKNEALGDLAMIAMLVSDRADLRQWSTLPSSFHLVRLFLPSGSYELELVGLDSEGKPSGEFSPSRKIVIQPGRKTFFNWRSLK